MPDLPEQFEDTEAYAAWCDESERYFQYLVAREREAEAERWEKWEGYL